MSEEKWPRHYAAEILKGQSREKRTQMLAAVPERFAALVRCHVEHAFNVRKRR